MQNQDSINKIEESFNNIKYAIHSNKQYAYSWLCNLAVPMQDENVPHETSNLAAARIMRLFFDYDMEDNEIYNSLMSRYPKSHSNIKLKSWFMYNGYKFAHKQFIQQDVNKINFGDSMTEWYDLKLYKYNGRKF